MSSNLTIGDGEKVSFIRQMDCVARSLQTQELGEYQVSQCLFRPLLPRGGVRDEGCCLTEMTPLGMVGFWCEAVGHRNAMQWAWNVRLQELLQEVLPPGEECVDTQVEALLTRVICSAPLNRGMIALAFGNILWIVAQGNVGCVWEEEAGDVKRDLFAQDEGVQVVSIESSPNATKRAILFSSKEFCVAVHTALDEQTIPNVNMESLGSVAKKYFTQKHGAGDQAEILTLVWEINLM